MGVLHLSQATEDAPTIIEGTLQGLTPGKHGIHVCTYGDMSDGGATSCGPIFNPFGRTHGAPENHIDQRMVGDLGNVICQVPDGAGDSAEATCVVKISDPVINLMGPHSIIGRSLVLYAGEDDCGRGGHENSLTTGNPGPRIGSGVIGLAKS